jgi:hypothetical protein
MAVHGKATLASVLRPRTSSAFPKPPQAKQCGADDGGSEKRSTYDHEPQPVTRDSCPFCSPAPSQIFYRDDLVIGLWDTYPVALGHALLIPIPHVPT